MERWRVSLCSPMRILFVSAHYPPDFTSGATLQAQRMARGAAAAGHTVAVYAGWIGGGRPERQGEHRAGETWDEVDEAGVPVHWIATGHAIGWSERTNFDNPDAAADFETFAKAFGPDIVHFEVLQTMGGALLASARRAGAKVVVTMHDFWWLCTRLFLVDKALQPCSLVVDCGVCSCEVDRAWMQERRAYLAKALESADLILAPSHSTAAVLVANGLGIDKVVVDENGVDIARPDGHRPPRERGAPLRFTYVGGIEALKGWGVLVEAAGMLSGEIGTAGWNVAAYGAIPTAGAEPDSGPAVSELRSLGIEARPPFDPTALPDVLADTDVLLLPSVMRETFSIVTREALLAGVPVVCTDSIGPEEIVVPGHNGLVVRSGDPAGLAKAMRSLLAAPDLVAAMAENAPSITVRPLVDQVEGLLGHYGRLVDQTPSPAADPSPPRRVGRVLFICGIEGAPLRYRARLPAEALELVGIGSEVRHYRDDQLPLAAARADVVVVYRVPSTPQILDLIQRTRRLGTPVLFDVDDLIFDPALAREIPALSLLPTDEAELWMQGIRRYRTTMEACDGFIGSTEILTAHAGQVTGLPTYRFDNGVSLAFAAQADRALRRPRTPGPLRIGYLSGTNTHTHDWAMVEPAVVAIMEEMPDAELWMVGEIEPTGALRPVWDRVRSIPAQYWLDLPGLLRDLDINLAPLVGDSRFNEAKSAIKWLEAALVATPTIASPTQPYQDAIRSGHTGILAKAPPEWEEALRTLASDGPMRDAMGEMARRDALLRWSPHLQGERYERILTQAVAAGPNLARKARFEVEPCCDEPFEPGHALEAYPGPIPDTPGQLPPERTGPHRDADVGLARSAPIPAQAPPARQAAAEVWHTRVRRVARLAERGIDAWSKHGALGAGRAGVRMARRKIPRR